MGRFDAECEGLDGFESTWVMTVLVLPGILASCIIVYFMIEQAIIWSQHHHDNSNAVAKLQSNLFIAVFIVYVLRLSVYIFISSRSICPHHISKRWTKSLLAGADILQFATWCLRHSTADQ